MPSLLARLGHTQMRRITPSLQTTGRKSRENLHVCGQCRANFHKTLRQRRSCGEESRSSVPGERKPREETLSSASLRPTSQGQKPQRHEIHNYTAAAVSESAAHDPNATFAEPASPYPAQDAQPSARAAGITPEPGSTQSLTDSEQVKLWEQFERDDDNGQTVCGGERGPVFSVGVDKRLNIDYNVELPVALLKREADMVIRCLFAAIHVNDHEFIRELPATTFSEIIRVLEPRHFMSPLASAHLELSAAMARQLGIAPMREVVYEYASVIKEVLSMRRGIRLTLSDFKALLRSARDLGHQKFAFMIWNVLWSQGHIPDTKCYNLYMSAAVWNGVHSAGGRQKVRVIDFNMIARRKERPKTNFRQYRVGAGGVREKAMAIFNEMLANGAVANEESFRILITAASREGDIATVRSILRKVWNIDVDALMAGEEEFNITPKPLPTHSPLHPTPQLLFIIAHAFGINNDIPSALRVVDFVARNYQIPITRAVWSQLFEWTFVLAIDRHGTDKSTGSIAGQIPRESVVSLWDIMTSAPYNIQPTMGMYNCLIKNLFQRNQTPKIVEKMREARELYFEHRMHARKLWFALQSKIREDKSTESVEELRHRYEAADLVRTRDLFWLKRWLRLLLGTYRDAHRIAYGEKSFKEELPGLLWEWRTYAPTVVRYETPTGFVEFKIRTSEEIYDYAKDRFQHKSRLRRELKGAQRYVGERWTGGEVRPAKRLMTRG